LFLLHREAPIQIVKKAKADLKKQIRIREYLLNKHKKAKIQRTQGAVYLSFFLG
jgi:hypothetical protein